jgi:hypothetical protein
MSLKSDSGKNDGFDFEKNKDQKRPEEENEQVDPLIEFLNVRKKLFFPSSN